MTTIEAFSKISGLTINRTKSECLLLECESDKNAYNDTLFGIPIVDTVKVLGHYFGKSVLVCDYQNFYNKLAKTEKKINLWKQRNLTLYGKNILINSYINSQIIHNCQISPPP